MAEAESMCPDTKLTRLPLPDRRPLVQSGTSTEENHGLGIVFKLNGPSLAVAVLAGPL